MSLNVCEHIKTNPGLSNYLRYQKNYGECEEAYIDEEKQILLYKNKNKIPRMIKIKCIDDETGNRLPVCTLDDRFVLQFNPYDIFNGGKRRKTNRRRNTNRRRKTNKRRKTNRRRVKK